MSPGVIALTLMSGIVAVGTAVGFLARLHHKLDLEQWTVGGRGFGLVLVWLLMAGEVFTIYTFLGASGWAYSKGAPVLYILGYAPLSLVVSYFILPGSGTLERNTAFRPRLTSSACGTAARI